MIEIIFVLNYCVPKNLAQYTQGTLGGQQVVLIKETNEFCKIPDDVIGHTQFCVSEGIKNVQSILSVHEKAIKIQHMKRYKIMRRWCRGGLTKTQGAGTV